MQQELQPPTNEEREKLLAQLRRFPFYELAAEAAGIEPDTARNWLAQATADILELAAKIKAGQQDLEISPFCKFLRDISRAIEDGEVDLLRPLVDHADKGRKGTQRWLAKWIRENHDGQKLVDRARESLKADPIREEPRKKKFKFTISPQPPQADR
jgi:hypothetical protein